MYKVNLLPPELVSRAELGEAPRRPPVIVVFVCVAGLLCLVYIGFAFYIYSARAKVTEIKHELAALEPEIQQVEALQSKTALLKNRAAAWRQITENRKTYYHFFKDLNRLLPVDMWLMSVDMAQPKVGDPVHVVIEGATGSLASVGVYINNLSGLPYLNGVTLKELKQETPVAVTVFTVDAYISDGGR
ncbi:MAG: PilN domain-containing protein [Bacillota bacterium]